ncbi:hypothetical protein DES38_101181 [Streptohalobacillus salinus]|uniref:Uncharacterized protein n=1 Tax=Streptohalobacillus salinus TaxID=621096 RepID=A0A2V3WK97_9BACI|nr:hypothetical protein DES38_101181 [Streptohalobacillus salinus]
MIHISEKLLLVTLAYASLFQVSFDALLRISEHFDVCGVSKRQWLSCAFILAGFYFRRAYYEQMGTDKTIQLFLRYSEV